MSAPNSNQTSEIDIDLIWPNRFNPNVMGQEAFTSLLKDVEIDDYDALIISPASTFYAESKAKIILKRTIPGTEQEQYQTNLFGQYVICDGEHRWKALWIKDKRKIRAEVWHMTEGEAMAYFYKRQWIRGLMDPFKEAELFRHELMDNGLTFAEVGEKYNITRSRIRKRLTLNNICMEAAALFYKQPEDRVGDLTVSHLRELAVLPPKYQVAVSMMIMKKGWTTRDVATEAQRIRAGLDPSKYDYDGSQEMPPSKEERQQQQREEAVKRREAEEEARRVKEMEQARELQEDTQLDKPAEQEEVDEYTVERAEFEGDWDLPTPVQPPPPVEEPKVEEVLEGYDEEVIEATESVTSEEPIELCPWNSEAGCGNFEVRSEYGGGCWLVHAELCKDKSQYKLKGEKPPRPGEPKVTPTPDDWRKRAEPRKPIVDTRTDEEKQTDGEFDVDPEILVVPPTTIPAEPPVATYILRERDFEELSRELFILAKQDGRNIAAPGAWLELSEDLDDAVSELLDKDAPESLDRIILRAIQMRKIHVEGWQK